MRNYFVFGLKWRAVLWPMLLYWLLSVLLFFGYDLLFVKQELMTSTTLVGGDWVAHMALYLATVYIVSVAMLMALFWVVKRSVAALKYKDSDFDTDYLSGEYLKQILPDMFFTIMTLGLYGPWMLTRLMRYFVRRTVHNGNAMEFEGRPMMLFCYVVLLGMLPVLIASVVFAMLLPTAEMSESLLVFWQIVVMMIIWGGISFCVAAIYARWLLHGWYGNRRLVCTVSIWDGGSYVLGQLLLSILTFGIYAPAAELKIMRYFLRGTVVGTDKVEGRFGMELRMWRDWGYLLGQMLLLIVTLGVYLPWYYVNVCRRFVGRIYVEAEQKPTEPMPALRD